MKKRGFAGRAALARGLFALALAAAAGPFAAAAEEFPVPRAMSPARADLSDLLRVLSDTDVERYRKIFDVQERGDWKTADRVIADLDSKALMSYVLVQRYMHPTAYTSTYGELAEWLAAYSDHPEAARIHKLALKKKPASAAAPMKPLPRKFRQDMSIVVNPAFTALDKSGPRKKRVDEINSHVKSLLARERPTQSIGYINDAAIRKQLTQVEYDEIVSWIAAQYFLERVPDKAAKTAGEVIARNREAVPMADWTAGLAKWQLGQFASAAEHFEALAHSRYIPEATRAGAAYWAARGYLVARQPAKVAELLEIAAETPLSFYGVLANRQLGNDKAYDWKMPTLSRQGAQRLLDTPAVERAVALAQIGRTSQADSELRRAHAYVSPELDRELLALAAQLDLPATQLQVAEYSSTPGLEAGLYPLPSFVPRNGFHVEPALLYAFMRKESKFVTDAESWAGARGLMQLMPRTASSVARDASLRNDGDRLYDPGFNLELGQDYIESLMASTGGNLFMLTVAYNGGPGNLRKWVNELTSNSDPLFFIESIPSRETRHFIEEVLTNLWIYHHRLGQESPSLDATAAGGWPVYSAAQMKDDRFATR